MSNILMIPASGAIIFDSQVPNSSIVSPLSTATRLSYDNGGGLNITSYTTSTSALDRFTVDGSSGRLFSVTDSLTGSIFSVNDVAGLPIIEVESNLVDKITMGAYGSNALVVNDTKVGIGTDTPAEKLSVVGNTTVTGYISASQYYGLQSALSGTAALVGGNTLGSNLLIGTNDNYNLNLETGGTTKMTITSAGLVGIGTANPLYTLAVNGAIGTSYSGIKLGDPVYTLDVSAANSITYKSSLNHIFYGASTELMRIDYPGNVKVSGNITTQGSVSAVGGYFGPTFTAGNFPTAGILLNYAGSSAGASYIDFYTSGAHGGQAAARLRSSNISGGAGFLLSRNGFFGWNEQSYAGQEDAGTGIMRDALGVIAQRNSTSPQELRIYRTYTDASNFERFFIKTNVGTTSATQIGLSAAGTGQNRNLEFATSGTTQMTITSSGNVGIGTTTPAYKLSVSDTSGGLPFSSSGTFNSRFYHSAYSLTYDAGNLDAGNNAGLNLTTTNGRASPSIRFTNSNAQGVIYLETNTSGQGNLEFRVNGYGALILRKGDNRQGNAILSSLSGDTTYNNASLLVRNRWDGSPGAVIAKLATTTTADIFQVTSESLSPYFNVNATGSVGVGVATPSAKLDIADTTLAGSGGLSGAALNITQTWNTTGAPTAIKLNVTNTASGAASNLLDLQVDTISKFKVDKNGVAILAGALYAEGGQSALTSSYLQLANSAGRIIFNSNIIHVATATGLGWFDLPLWRDAANTLAQRNGINAQTFRLYNTYTDTISAFERLNIKWDTDIIKIGTEKGITGGIGRAMELQTDGTTRMRIASTGNVGIGTTSPLNKLHVEGTANGEGLRVSHSAGVGTQLDIITGDGSVAAVGSTSFRVNNSSTLILNAQGLILPQSLVRAGNNTQTINIHGGYSGSTLGNSLVLGSNTINGGPFTATSGTQNTVSIGIASLESWNPASGNATYNLLRIAPVVNTSGTYAGIVRGLYINPTLTSVTGTDFRALDLSNTSGFGVYQSGASASNYFAGNVGIGTTTPSERLAVVGNTTVTGYVSAAQYYGLQASLSATAALIGGNSIGSNLLIGTNDNFNLNLETSGTTKMTVTSGGNIGVGTTTPDYLLTVAGTAKFTAGQTSNIDLVRNDGNLMPGALSTSSVGGQFVTLGNSGNSNGTLIYGNSTNGIGISVGGSVNLSKPTILGNLNGTSNTTDLSIYNTSGGQTKIGIKLGNSSTSINSNIAINFVDYTDTPYGQIRGVYDGAVQTGQLSFLTANGGALAESLRISNTGNVGIGTTTPIAKLDIVDTTLAGSGGLSGAALNITQTWNTTGAPTAIKLNVTNTASGAASNLLDLQVDGSNRFRVDKDGVTTVFGTFNTCTLKITQIGSNQTNGFGPYGGNAILAYANGARTMLLGYGGGYTDLRLTAAHRFGWTSDAFSAAAALDTILVRDAANTLALRNDVNPQELRIYRTFTDAANYERFYINTNTGTTSATQIGLSAVGTGQNRNLEFATAGTTQMTITSAGNVGIGMVSDSHLLSLRTPNATSGSYTSLSIAKHTNSSAEGRSRIILSGDFGNSFHISQNGYTNQSQGVAVPEHAAFFEIFNQNGIFIGTGSAANQYAQFSNSIDKRFSIYSTLNASITNYERLSIKPQSGGAFLIMSEAAGTGTYRDIEIQNGGSTRMTVTSAGNIGIGTTTPTDRLTVDGNIVFTGTSTSRSISTQPATYSGTGPSLTIRSGDATSGGAGGNINIIPGVGQGGPGAGQINLGSYTLGLAQYINLNSYQTIINSIGPNTGTPLTVNGGGRELMSFNWDNINNVTTLKSSSTSSIRLSGAIDYQIAGSNSLSSRYALNVTNSLSSSIAYFRNDGKVGIGTTDPRYNFSVRPSTSHIGQIGIKKSTLYNAPALFFEQDNGAGSYYMGADYSGVFQMHTSSGYNVFSTAGYRTSIKGNATNVEAGNSVVNFDNGSQKILLDAAWVTNSIIFYTNTTSTERMRIQGNGNVGIGTTSATARLDVVDTTLAGSGALSGSALNIAQTWNTTGAPTAIKLNVTNTASGAASNLLDLQVGGVSSVKVSKNGLVTVDDSFASGGFVFRPGNSNSGGIGYLNGGGYGIWAGSGTAIGFTTGAALNGSIQTALYTDGTGQLALRNGGNPQAFRLYNTFTDTISAFERLNIKWDTNVLKIGTEKGSTGGVARSMEFQTDGTTRMTFPATGGLSLPSGSSIDFGGAFNYYGTTSSTTINGPTVFGQVEISVNGSNKWIFKYDGLFCGGGTTSSFPAIKRNGAALQTRLADDSANADLETANLTVVGSISAAGDIEVATSLQGVILVSPNSTRWKITVNDDGSLQTTAL